MRRQVLFVGFVATVMFAMGGCGGQHGRYHGGGYGEREHGVERGMAEMSALVDRAVKDPEKAKQVKQIVTEIVQEVEQGYGRNREYHEKLYQLNASYTATPEDFTKVLDEATNARMQMATKILGLRFKMKDLLTADEWKALTDEMNALRSRYRRPAQAGKDK